MQATQKRSRRQVNRSCRLQDVGDSLVLSILMDHGNKQELDHYHVERVPAEFGRAFRLTKFSCCGGEVYDVLLDGDRSSCECKGHLRWGHCKHVDCCRKLVELGRLGA